MTSKAQRPPAGEPWVWQTRELISSDAWRSRGINVVRLIEFLSIEHMSKAGKRNGELKAPQRQLVQFGISSSLVAATIREAEALGLIDRHSGGQRVAATYRLTWLPNSDGEPATDRWRSYRNPTLAPLPAPKKRKSALTSVGSAALSSECRWPESALTSEGRTPRKSALRTEGALKNLLTKAVTTDSVELVAASAGASE